MKVLHKQHSKIVGKIAEHAIEDTKEHTIWNSKQWFSFIMFRCTGADVVVKVHNWNTNILNLTKFNFYFYFIQDFMTLTCLMYDDVIQTKKNIKTIMNGHSSKIFS